MAKIGHNLTCATSNWDRHDSRALHSQSKTVEKTCENIEASVGSSNIEASVGSSKMQQPRLVRKEYGLT